jgi:hypothetical protein
MTKRRSLNHTRSQNHRRNQNHTRNQNHGRNQNHARSQGFSYLHDLPRLMRQNLRVGNGHGQARTRIPSHRR